jgi:light-independent protochlorophyllide reductase subunit B
VSEYCEQVLISDDNAEVSDATARLKPSAIFGTQMERHIRKRLDIPYGVIASPIHIQN